MKQSHTHIDFTVLIIKCLPCLINPFFAKILSAFASYSSIYQISLWFPQSAFPSTKYNGQRKRQKTKTKKKQRYGVRKVTLILSMEKQTRKKERKKEGE